jgi:hypothetical protein
MRWIGVQEGPPAAGLAGIAARSIHDRPLIRGVPEILMLPTAQEWRALGLLHTYMAKGGSVKKCGWSC